MEPVAFIPESMSAMNALKQMRRQRLHMMVVVDEFGGTSGIVTLEDILETLVGEIYDEDDEEELVEDTSSIVQVLRAMPMPTALPTSMFRVMCHGKQAFAASQSVPFVLSRAIRMRTAHTLSMAWLTWTL